MSDLNVKEKFILLRAQGVSFEKIAKELGRAKQTLVNWSRELESEIANAKAIELDSLNEQFFLSKQRRLESLGGVIARLRTELEQRDLSDLPTDKLLDLNLKYQNAIREEFVEPKFKSQGELEDEQSNRNYLEELINGARKIRKPESA